MKEELKSKTTKQLVEMSLALETTSFAEDNPIRTFLTQECGYEFDLTLVLGLGVNLAIELAKRHDVQ